MSSAKLVDLKFLNSLKKRARILAVFGGHYNKKKIYSHKMK